METGQHLITFSVRLNLWSFGERVAVSLGSVEGCSIVDITSSCHLRTQIVDWGKNERNVRRLFDAIDKILGDECQHVTCLLCEGCGYLLVGIPAGFCPECGHEWSANDRPGRQDVATIRNAVTAAVVFTAVEVGGCFLLKLLNIDDFLPWMLKGIRGAIFLFCVNLGASLGIFGLHRLMKRYVRRR